MVMDEEDLKGMETQLTKDLALLLKKSLHGLKQAGIL